MSGLARLIVVCVCVSLIGSTGCGSKDPAKSPATNPTEGPKLAPPQQTPAAPTGDRAAFPTGGDPEGKVAAKNDPNWGAANKDQSGQPTAGEPQGGAVATDTAETAEAAKIKASLALLSASDRALAEKQKICPVSGEPLGAMGAPPKVTVAGREVFVCCKSCEEPLAQEPAKYLATIGLEPAK